MNDAMEGLIQTCKDQAQGKSEDDYDNIVIRTYVSVLKERADVSHWGDVKRTIDKLDEYINQMKLLNAIEYEGLWVVNDSKDVFNVKKDEYDEENANTDSFKTADLAMDWIDQNNTRHQSCYVV